MAAREHYRLGVDIGGTFTDIALVPHSGTAYGKKLLSTPEDYSAAIEAGLQELLNGLYCTRALHRRIR